MKYLLLASALLSSQVFAKDMTLNCTANMNASNVFETQVVLKPGQSNLIFGDVDGLRFLLSSKANNVIELQVYNPQMPSRTYATTTFKGAGSFVELSFWTQDLLLDLRCTAL
jgi:hypothetical protein